MLLDQKRAGLDIVNQEGPRQDGHDYLNRDPQGQKRDEGALVCQIVCGLQGIHFYPIKLPPRERFILPLPPAPWRLLNKLPRLPGTSFGPPPWCENRSIVPLFSD